MKNLKNIYNMQSTHNMFIKLHTKMSDIISDNYLILLLLEHFEIDFAVGNKTVEQICIENNINPDIFVAIGNIYNGFSPSKINNASFDDVLCLIKLLRNTHVFYKQDKYPEIQGYINKLYADNNSAEILLVEKFFTEYFSEVVEHLNYEDEIAFPYFTELLKYNDNRNANTDFSVITYQEHHTDIESKLADLKNLLLKHISLKNNFPLRRKLLFSLFELEFDLNIHSLIEEKILIPIIQDIESTINE